MSALTYPGASAEVIRHAAAQHRCKDAEPVTVACPCGDAVALVCSQCGDAVLVALRADAPACPHGRHLMDRGSA